jgi:hypothetical protein
VEITAALAADLAILSEGLDERGPGLADAVDQLASDAWLAVRSYLGLTILAQNATFPLLLTAMKPFAHADDVVSSLMLPLTDEVAEAADQRPAVILYAGRLGAFVDLAADLCWLTGRQLSEFALDQHLRLPAEPNWHTNIRDSSVVNQAIGVLIGRSYTPEQAKRELDARATAAGQTLAEAANIILSGLDPRRGSGSETS